MYEAAPRIAVCRLCRVLPFHNHQLLYAHLRTEHANSSNLFLCDICEFATSSPSNLNIHKNGHSEYRSIMTMKPKLPPSTHIILKCAVCGYETTSRKVLEGHVLDKHIDKPKIHHCITASNERLSALKLEPPLKREVLISRTRKKNVCAQCGLQCEDTSKLMRHVISHQPSLRETILSNQAVSVTRDLKSPRASCTADSCWFWCNICGYSCDTQRSIKAHMWRHSGHKNLEYPTFQSSHQDGSFEEIVPVINGIVTNNQLSPCPSSPPSPSAPSASSLDCCPNGELKMDAVLDPAPSVNTVPKTPSLSQPNVIVELLQSDTGLYVPLSEERLSERRGMLPLSVSSPPHTHKRCAQLDVNQNRLPLAIVAKDLMPVDSPDTENEAERIMRQVCEAINKQSQPVTGQEVGATVEALPPCVDSPTASGDSSRTATEESAATLLTLLRQSPNHSLSPDVGPKNPSHTLETMKKESSKDRSDSLQNSSVRENSAPGSVPQRKGICSSLLAVIEQLRERQSYADSSISKSAGPKEKVRRKRKRASSTINTDQLMIDAYPNAERISGPSDHSVANPGSVSYRCKLCHYSATSRLMKQHMKMHKCKQPFECSLCDHVANSSQCLQEHMIQHCKARLYQCKLCQASFSYKSQLRAHSRVHEEGSAFYCDACEYVSSNLTSFKEHMAVHPERVSSFTCVTCRKKFAVLEDLCVHLKKSCSEAKQVRISSPSEAHGKTSGENGTIDGSETADCNLNCKECDFVAFSVRSLKSHLKRHVNDKRYIEQPLEQYKCNLCGYVCHHLPSLKSHMWRHASEANFTYSFADLLSEKTMPTDIQGVPLVTLRCCQCGFETLDKVILNDHMRTHWDVIKKDV